MKFRVINTGKSKLTYKIINDDDIKKIVDDIVVDIQTKLKEKPEIKIFGKICHQQRDVGFFSNVSKGYKYSGQIMASQPLTDKMDQIIRYVNKCYKTNYNSILINKYNDGRDYISKHSDDENGLEKSGVVGISYGAVRTFRIRKKDTNEIQANISLQPYSMVQMAGDFQKEFTHEIPIEKQVKNSRISFTFRNHIW